MPYALQRPRLHYERTGRGNPLLCITGFTISSAIYEPVLPLWSARFDCITYDNRGSGRSGAPLRTTSMAELAADAARLLDALDVPSAHVFGISMGGMIAQELALRFPERVRGLLLAGTTPGGPRAARPAVRELAAAGAGLERRSAAAVGVVGNPSLLVGRTIAGFRLDAVLGKSPLGAVYRAHQLAMARDVAFRAFKPEVADQVGFAERLLTSARRAGTLRHPGVVQIHECGQDDEIGLRMDAGRQALYARGDDEAGPYQSPMEDGMQQFHEWYLREMGQGAAEARAAPAA